MKNISGAEFRRYRLSRGLSQQAMSERVGLSRMTIHYIETKPEISPKDQRVIDEALGTKWREQIPEARASEELKLLRALTTKVDEINARLAEIEDAQGIKHRPVSRAHIARLQN